MSIDKTILFANLEKRTWQFALRRSLSFNLSTLYIEIYIESRSVVFAIDAKWRCSNKKILLKRLVDRFVEDCCACA